MERVEVDGEVFLFPSGDNPMTSGSKNPTQSSKQRSNQESSSKTDIIMIEDEPGPSTGGFLGQNLRLKNPKVTFFLSGNFVHFFLENGDR